MLMMEPGDEFVTMDTVRRKGQVRVWKVLVDGQVTQQSPVYRSHPGDDRPDHPGDDKGDQA